MLGTLAASVAFGPLSLSLSLSLMEVRRLSAAVLTAAKVPAASLAPSVHLVVGGRSKIPVAMWLSGRDFDSGVRRLVQTATEPAQPTADVCTDRLRHRRKLEQTSRSQRGLITAGGMQWSAPLDGPAHRRAGNGRRDRGGEQDRAELPHHRRPPPNVAHAAAWCNGAGKISSGRDAVKATSYQGCRPRPLRAATIRAGRWNRERA
jgi:hypothetical protein